MNLSKIIILFFLIPVFFSGCAPKTAPYDHGPVMSQKSIEYTFEPILDFMEYEPGMSFADVGAGSGAFTVMMSSLMRNSKIYVQDIDTAILYNNNLEKILDHYSQQSGKDLRMKNEFSLIIGDIQQTNLPDSTFDLIYSNATLHNFTSLDSMLIDLGRKLKSDGVLFLRDGFKNYNGEGELCSDPECGRPYLEMDEFLATMEKHGFEIKKQSPDMKGFPIFGFLTRKKREKQ
jgi:SAM-dependent methyltransferase